MAIIMSISIQCKRYENSAWI